MTKSVAIWSSQRETNEIRNYKREKIQFSMQVLSKGCFFLSTVHALFVLPLQIMF